MYSLIKELALPPANLLVLVIAGYLLRRRRSGKILIATGFVALCLLSNAFVSSHLLKALEAGIAAPGPQAAPPQAIVVLSAGYLALQPGSTTPRLTLAFELTRSHLLLLTKAELKIEELVREEVPPQSTDADAESGEQGEQGEA